MLFESFYRFALRSTSRSCLINLLHGLDLDTAYAVKFMDWKHPGMPRVFEVHVEIAIPMSGPADPLLASCKALFDQCKALIQDPRNMDYYNCYNQDSLCMAMFVQGDDTDLAFGITDWKEVRIESVEATDGVHLQSGMTFVEYMRKRAEARGEG
jgi:hypothetical protein